MSRAFVSENDGWRRCLIKMEDCMFADDLGKCILNYCKKFGETPPKPEDEPAEPKGQAAPKEQKGKKA